MPRPVGPFNAVAGCAAAVVLVILTGCTGAAPSGQASTRTPTVGSGASTVPPAGGTTTSRTTTPPAVHGTGQPTPSRMNQPPVVRSISSVPEQVNPLDCMPPQPPERPEVIVEVVDPDDPVDALEVWLQYSSGPAYDGDVRMRFDRKRTAFVYTLPPVTRAAVGNDARNITIGVQVRSSILQPPFTHWIPFKGYCQGTIGNG
jgi:hypothetical protein